MKNNLFLWVLCWTSIVIRQRFTNAVCQVGYNESCQVNCAQHCLWCDKSGICLQCERGRYGGSCVGCITCIECSTCALTTCNMTGYCSWGCENGSWGPLCENSCPQHCLVCDREIGHCGQCEGSYYGHHCTKTCSSGCMNSQCNMTGFCTGGCQDGRHGNTCDEMCDIRCTTCEQLSGECLTCLNGLKGHKCQEIRISPTNIPAWILVTAVCVLIVSVILILIKRNNPSLCSSASISPGDNYISPVMYEEGSVSLPVNHLPLHDIRNDAYETIEDSDSTSPQPCQIHQIDREYESI